MPMGEERTEQEDFDFNDIIYSFQAGNFDDDVPDFIPSNFPVDSERSGSPEILNDMSILPEILDPQYSPPGNSIYVTNGKITPEILEDFDKTSPVSVSPLKIPKKKKKKTSKKGKQPEKKSGSPEKQSSPKEKQICSFFNKQAILIQNMEDNIKTNKSMKKKHIF